MKPWLKELVKTANLGDDFDPVIKPAKTPDGYINDDGSLYKEFDYMSLLPNIENLYKTGDPRFTLGHMVCAVFKKYMPQITLYTEVSQAGGCQVIENYICDADGVPIQELSVNCPAGIKIETINPQEVIDYVNNTYTSFVEKDIDAFVSFILKTFGTGGYFLSANVLAEFPIFWITASTGNVEYYYKYPYQDKDKVAKRLGLTIQEVDVTLLNSDFLKSFTSPASAYNTDFTF